MPFGLRNASQTFQRFVVCVLRGRDFCCAHVDDILIASKTKEEHIQRLEEVFRRLDEHGLVVILDKCCFGRAEVSFLGHIVNAQGVRHLQAKVKAVTDFPQPCTKRQLRRFLGMINFYRRFIANCAEVAASLVPLNGGPNDPIEMSNEQLAAFQRLKTSLADVATLVYPNPDAQLSLMVTSILCFVVMPQIKKGSRTQRRIKGIQTLIHYSTQAYWRQISFQRDVALCSIIAYG